ncbi:MAG: cardiolipin synthase [Pseudomonadales bacterium]|nr:cardiolipin synthase [Pseudomonadales bacterium]
MDWSSIHEDIERLIDTIPWFSIVSGIHLVLWLAAVFHALLYKRDPRSALGWVAVSLLFPVVGPLLYYMFGINRVETYAVRFSGRQPRRLKVGYERGAVLPNAADPLPPAIIPHSRIAEAANRICTSPLVGNNRVLMLKNGNEAYPEMLDAIAQARHYVLLASYLFETDRIGRKFIQALADAAKRGVKVWVLVDGVGEFYSWPRASRLLRKSGVTVARFLPPRLLPPTFFINLRNHRKILVVDGVKGFTGGMNIGGRHMVDPHKKTGTVDVHFSVSGPVVEQLVRVFAEDWRFATRQQLALPSVDHVSCGPVFARCIRDGPNDDMDKIALVVNAAISAALKSITIVTPYFLPSPGMISSLQSAALRGVEVAIILPEKSNLRFVDWACRNMLWEVVQFGIKVFYQPSPFDHSKLLVVDGVYAQIGSANMDPRSLRLNFELNMELFDDEIVKPLALHAEQLREGARLLTLEEIEGRSLWVRLRDALFWLFTPYL